MKKILFLFIATGLLLACKDPAGEENHATEDNSKHAHTEGALTLNGNAKWKSDSATLANVQLLEKAISMPAGANAADELEQAVNKMISECKMRGPDHDMLHVWLEPILKDINSLKTETDAEKSKALLKKLDERIRLFHDYFEYTG